MFTIYFIICMISSFGIKVDTNRENNSSSKTISLEKKLIHDFLYQNTLFINQTRFFVFLYKTFFNKQKNFLQ